MSSPEISMCLHHLCPRKRRLTRGVGLSGTYLHIHFWSGKCLLSKVSDGIQDSTGHSYRHMCYAHIHSGISSQKRKKVGGRVGKHISAFFGTINEGFLLKGRMKTRENMEPLNQNLKLLSVWDLPNCRNFLMSPRDLKPPRKAKASFASFGLEPAGKVTSK